MDPVVSCFSKCSSLCNTHLGSHPHESDAVVHIQKYFDDLTQLRHSFDKFRHSSHILQRPFGPMTSLDVLYGSLDILLSAVSELLSLAFGEALAESLEGVVECTVHNVRLSLSRVCDNVNAFKPFKASVVKSTWDI